MVLACHDGKLYFLRHGVEEDAIVADREGGGEDGGGGGER